MRGIWPAIAFVLLTHVAEATPANFALVVTDGKLAGPGAEILRAELPTRNSFFMARITVLPIRLSFFAP
jgi:hypothetical protein